MEKSMKTVINKSGEFTYTAELRPLQTPPGSYHLSFQSTFGGAKDPEGLRTLFQVTTDASGLLALRDLINDVVEAVTP
jgi:hypothetical protein